MFNEGCCHIMQKIEIRGARTHNLKNVNLDLPRDKLIVFTGLSGSGKSSLAFDTLYAEGQRRYVESLSAYARQFLSMMEKPDVDHIEGLSPAISIEQKSTSHNPRSTVGTVTEIHDYLRLLFARVGEPRCPEHQIVLEAQTISQMVDTVLELPKDSKIMILAPVVRGRKGEYQQLFAELRADGYIRVRVDGHVYELDEVPKLKKNFKHDIEVVIDRLKVNPDQQQRLADSLETATGLADGLAYVVLMDETNGSATTKAKTKTKTKGKSKKASATKSNELVFHTQFSCPMCGYSLSELEPRLFSFNNPAGACQSCDGLGVKQFFDPERVVLHPEMSLANGAVRGWDKRNVYYYQMLVSLAKHYGFDVNKPFAKLPKRIQQTILFGSGDEVIQFKYLNDRGDQFTRRHAYEGVIPNLERRYRDTDSMSVREELAKYLTIKACDDCGGTRLRQEARNVFIGDHCLPELSALSIEKSLKFFKGLKLTGHRGKIATKILKEIIDRLTFLANVGLEYLTLDRSAETLSGGEAQRIRLASQIGSGLVGVMYILDEPSIGLHQRDNRRLLDTLIRLRDLGNTVIVVEHDEDAIREADWVIDLGVGAGVHGGRVIAEGPPEEIIITEKSITGQYLSGKRQIKVPETRVQGTKDKKIVIKGAKGNNLKNIAVEIPIGLMTCITGVSGSGKSTLINDTLYPAVARALNGAEAIKPREHESIEGLEWLDKVIDINQSPIGRTPRSNPATYTGIFTPVRELFAGTQEARARGYKPGRFSFNVKGGRCETCQGDGLIKVEMHFLPDIYVVCDSCKGQRYNRETLEVKYKGKNIFEVLSMTVEDAREFFDPIPVVARKLQTLIDVGLSYITLGQSATTLSGGEAQRVKLSRELSKRDTGRTLYILDEPTTGLHFHDIQQLLHVLHRLRDGGNTIIVIEHNLDVIKTADWIIDLGPEGGDKGGEVIAFGTPEQVSDHKKSYTGQFLRPLLSDQPSLTV